MKPVAMTRDAGRVIVESLVAHEVDRVFCVAGESYLPVLDALRDLPEADVVTCRHEGSAAFMALADAKLTRRAGVCLVSRGPGAANAAIGVHAAAEDATPLLLLVGGVRVDEIDREPFQGMDFAHFFGGFAKAVWTLYTPDAAAQLLSRAFRLAESGTPGPVVVVLPEDVLEGTVTGPPVAGRPKLARPEPAAPDLQEVRELLATAQRPLLLAGARLDTADGRAVLRRVAGRHNLPVVTSNKNQHLLPNRDPHYAGHLHNATQARQLEVMACADLVLAVGTRLDEVTTKARQFPAGQPLVHVYPDGARLGTYHETRLGIPADPVAFLRHLEDWEPTDPGGTRQPWLKQLHHIETQKASWRAVEARDGVVFGAVAAALDEITKGEATVVVDSGTFTSWIYRYLRFGEQGRLLGISSSAMGFAVGAGVAAALRAPETPVISVVGDGGFLMNNGELITAVERNLPVVFIVANNGSYATIRAHQERAYPRRVIATDLANPDFARMAESFGALGLCATTPGEVRPCLTKALDHAGPAVVEVRTSLRHITAYRTLDIAG